MLKRIENSNQGRDDCKMSMLNEWLEKGGATRQSLASALRKMGENGLAGSVLTSEIGDNSVLTGSAAATDLPPSDTSTQTLTEEPLGKLKRGILQVELCCYVEIRDSISKKKRKLLDSRNPVVYARAWRYLN